MNDHEDEFTFFVEAHVVVTNDRVAAHEGAQLVLLLGKALGEQIKANADDACFEEVHLTHLILFIEYQLFFLARVVLAWSQAKDEIVEELGTGFRFRIEKQLELGVDVIEQVIVHYLAFVLSR